MRVMGNRSLLLCLGLLVFLAVICGQASARPFAKSMQDKARENGVAKNIGAYD